MQTRVYLKEITLEKYRCFSSKQSVRLAPLTVLIGENSTGKTSLLAMLRPVLDAAQDYLPNFKQPPFDLGSFADIAHHRGRRGGQADSFTLAFRFVNGPGVSEAQVRSYRFSSTFEKRGTAPVAVKKSLKSDNAWIETYLEDGHRLSVRVGYDGQTLEFPWPPTPNEGVPDERLSTISLPSIVRKLLRDAQTGAPNPTANGSSFSSADVAMLLELAMGLWLLVGHQVYASGPVRSRPLRTYDPIQPYTDPEGVSVPSYLASLSSARRDDWEVLQGRLQEFGQKAGIFDEIKVKRFEEGGSSPFQMQFRKFGKRSKGPPRNMIDMGYGISQVLPTVTELLRGDSGNSLFLLQQPEVHLHPSAQAALGSLFCEIAADGRQLIIETHSDFILDRITMAVRDPSVALRSEDVSILFFERNDLEVVIHEIGLDERGNICDAPDTYRAFFMQETLQVLGL